MENIAKKIEMEDRLIKIEFSDGKKISMSEKRAKELFWCLNKYFANKFVGKDTTTIIIPNTEVIK